MPNPKKTCRHCHKRPAWRPRGLCWSCHRNTAIRALYPIESKYAPKREPTEAELDLLIAERMRNLPKWWNRSGKLAEAPRIE